METSRCGRGWQFGKSVLQRLTYIFDNRLATDVCFEVGRDDGKTEDIFAHKVILIAQSPVFEAMLCGDFALRCSGAESGGARIRVRDTDAEPFEDMLRYVWSVGSRVHSIIKILNLHLLQPLHYETLFVAARRRTRGFEIF